MAIHIADLRQEDVEAVHQAAELLVAEFSEHWPHAWPALDTALDEVRECLAGEHIVRVATDSNTVVGWTCGMPSYGGRVWEMHPLVVRSDRQGQGVGRALVEDLITLVGERGGLTLWVGTDDEDSSTTLAGVDLYSDLPGKLAGAQGHSGHPLGFYLRLGFTVTGVMPDANGRGKPDIYMAKRV